MNQAVPASPLAARRSGALNGRIRVPGDKSISLRSLILGALAVGETQITGMLEGEDAISTANAMKALGAVVERTGERAWRVRGVGVGGFAEPSAPLDFGNSGTGCRLAMGAVAGCPITVTFDGDASLRTRPMRRILDPLERMGARTLEIRDGGRLPAVVRGARDPIPIEYEAPVPSAQLKSAVLLAGLAAPGATTVIEKEATRDHTEKMLKHFGATVRVTAVGQHGKRITLEGQPELVAAPVIVPADPSSAAFPLVAALIVPGSEIVLEGVMLNPLRTGLYLTLKEMGASIEMLDQRNEGGEDVADLRIKAGALKGVDGAGRARADHDRRISDPRDRRVFRRRHHPDERAEGIARQGIRPARGHRRDAARQRRRGRDRGRRPDRARQGTRGRRRRCRDPHGSPHRHVGAGDGACREQAVAVDDAAFIATSFPGFTDLMRALGADFS